MNSLIQTRIDEESKLAAEAIFRKMGMSLSDGIRIFICQVINDRALPFQPSLGHEPSKEAIQAIEAAEQDIKRGKVFGPYKNPDNLMADLLKD